MGIELSVKKKWVWENEISKMVPRYEVKIHLVTNHGTILDTEGPLLCADHPDVVEASAILRTRFRRRLCSEAGVVFVDEPDDRRMI